MAVVTIEQPNEFNYAKQTIPFLVRSSLVGVPGGIDPIEKAFRFVFDVLVQYSTGQYKTYASVAIPPRPDNYFAFFDAAPLVLDALTFDLATQKQTYASACPNSIVKFRVFCTERYLDTNGNFTSGSKTSLGEYYAIDGAGNEGISPYLLDNVTSKKPLHHHFLVDPEELVVSENEPLTLSWLSKNDLGVNELEYIHGSYGTFDNSPTVGTASTNNVLNVYSGITKNALTTILPAANVSYGGANSIKAKMTGITAGGNTNIMVFKFTGIDLSPSTSYQFRIWARIFPGQTVPASTAYSLSPAIVGTNFTAFAGTNQTISALQGGWLPITVQFATTTLFVTGDIEVQIRYVSNSSLSPLGSMNNVEIHYDSASMFEINPSSATAIGDIQVVTDAGTVYTMPSGYTANILPLNDTWQSRFDTPVGPYKIYYSAGQDATTGFWLNSGGSVANWFQLRIRNTSGTVMGISEKIYQKSNNCDIYDKFRLKWKNSLGGWDYFTFTKVSKAKTSIERENFKRSRGLISATAYQELSTDRGYQSLNIKLEDTYTVISDWIGDGTAKWMLDLFTSDEVYILNPEPFQRYVTTNEYDLEYPVFVQQTDVEFMNNSNEAKLKNYVIDITPAIRWDENTTN